MWCDWEFKTPWGFTPLALAGEWRARRLNKNAFWLTDSGARAGAVSAGGGARHVPALLRVRGEIMGSQSYGNIVKAQCVLVMKWPVISPRTRVIGSAERAEWEGALGGCTTSVSSFS
jgi:hypothetical protein